MKIDIPEGYQLSPQQREFIRRLAATAGTVIEMESMSGVRYMLIITRIQMTFGVVSIDMYYRSVNSREWSQLVGWSGLRQLGNRSGYTIQGVNDED